jgi:hypothetical protein
MVEPPSNVQCILNNLKWRYARCWESWQFFGVRFRDILGVGHNWGAPKEFVDANQMTSQSVVLTA